MGEGSERNEEAKHRRYERTIGTITLIATLCAAGFAGGAYVQARRQADIAQAALIESDHPFLKLSLQNKSNAVWEGKTYASLTVTIANLGSKAAALQLVHFAIVNDPAQVVPPPGGGLVGGLRAFQFDCVDMRSRKVVPANGSVQFDCKSQVPVPEKGVQHFAGLFTYTGQLGVTWSQWVDLIPDYPNAWTENPLQPAFNRETRVDARGNEISPPVDQ